jgi:choline dehydrogenase-like flavoprotein
VADRAPNDDVDVCVVGAGPAGALVARRLAERDHEVVVLEAGPRFDEDSRTERLHRSLHPGFERTAVWDVGGDRDAYTSTGEWFYPLNRMRVKGVGGSTLHWQGIVPRLHEADFERNSRDGVGRDWPMGYADLRPYYAAAERALGVASAADNPFGPPRHEPYPMGPFRPSHSDGIFASACESLGITTHAAANARNSERYDGDSACVAYGTCQPVCPSGAKYDARRTIVDAEAAGARVLDRVPVQQVIHGDAAERVTAVEYVTPDGTRHRQSARQVVLACGGVETARLLLLSASPQFPDGLANSSGAVGRYVMEHLFAGTGGTLDRRTRQHHVGFLTTESHQFYDDPAAGTDAGLPAADDAQGGTAGDGGLGPIKLEFLNYAGPTPAEVAVTDGGWGDDLLATVREAYGNHVAVGGLVGQLPRAENRITLDESTTDDHGNPVPSIEWTVDARTRRTIERANAIQERILAELGADRTWQVGPENTGPAAHHMGTTRMGTDPTESVVDPEGRTHDLENCWIASSSVFVTSGAMNPTLTIAALALRTADAVDRALRIGQ